MPQSQLGVSPEGRSNSAAPAGNRLLSSMRSQPSKTVAPDTVPHKWSKTMNFLKRNSDSGGRPPLILLVLAALFMPFVEGYKKLKEKVYRGWEGAFRAVL